MGKPRAVPLYRCVDCGFVTTASLENAARAHEVGSPKCAGQIALIADFSRGQTMGPPSGRRRRSVARRESETLRGD